MSMTLSTSHWLYAQGKPACSAVFKQQPDDFQVTEDLGYSPSGEGEHQFVWVEKRLANTAWVAEQLAKYTGLPLRNVTYAGRKDKYATTTQWFGLHAPGKPDFDFSALNVDGVSILKQTRHHKKLRTGQLKGNQFAITLRQVSDVDALIARLQHTARYGVPNYYGEQRFGTVRVDAAGKTQEGGNLMLAARMVGGEQIRNRNKRSMALSALRSWLFNEMVSERIHQAVWDSILKGDALMLSGSNSFFIHDGSDSDVLRRYQTGDLSPTAPLWGKGNLPTNAQAMALEMAVSERHSEVSEFLESSGLKQERRAVKIWPADLEWQQNGDTVNLIFSLPAGCFATTVLRECAVLSTPISPPSPAT